MKYTTKTIKLIGQSQKDLAKSAIDNAPLDLNLEVVIREQVKARTLDQNAAMFAGVLRDMENQLWVNGRTYKAEIWHEWAKAEYLPDEITEPYTFEQVKNPETYRKWDINPKGDRVLVGSTTELTKHGFHLYHTQLEAYATSHGVLLSAPPERGR